MIPAKSFFRGVLMEQDCRKSWRLGMPCGHGLALPALGEPAVPPVNVDHTSPAGIVFGTEPPKGAVLIPGYNAVPPVLRTVRDPSLSLIALSGIEPTGPVMVEVPLVLNNTTFTASTALAGWRIGYVARYVRGDHSEPIEHSSALREAFEVLRQAGVQWVAVDAPECVDIDDLVTRYRLDALVSDDANAAFQGACQSGYPSICESLEGGMKLWFYGARWSANSLNTLVRVYRQHVAGMTGLEGNYAGR